MSVNKDDIFRIVLAAVISLLAYIGNDIRVEQIDQGCRLRIVELQQVRIMERMGIDPLAAQRTASEKDVSALPSARSAGIKRIKSP